MLPRYSNCKLSYQFLIAKLVTNVCYHIWYDEQKVKGTFQHSSFLAGGVTTAAGRLLVNHGVLQVTTELTHPCKACSTLQCGTYSVAKMYFHSLHRISTGTQDSVARTRIPFSSWANSFMPMEGAVWQLMEAHSGHYLPTPESFRKLISSLSNSGADLTVAKVSIASQIAELVNAKTYVRYAVLCLVNRINGLWLARFNWNLKTWLKNERKSGGCPRLTTRMHSSHFWRVLDSPSALIRMHDLPSATHSVKILRFRKWPLVSCRILQISLTPFFQVQT